MEERISKLEQELEQLKKGRIYQSQYIPKSIKQPAIDGIIIFRGNVADRPDDGSTEIQCFYAEDEKKLYIYNTVNEAWEYEELS